MSQQMNFGHRGSVPNNLYQQYNVPVDQTQQRSFSVSQAPSIRNASVIATHGSPQWRPCQSFLANSPDLEWRRRQQYAQLQTNSPQSNNVNSINIVGEVSDVINLRKPNEGPWSSLGTQQHAPQQFDGDQFRTHGSGARTAFPDTPSQQRSFVDSAYHSDLRQNQPLALSTIHQQGRDHFRSPMNRLPNEIDSNRSPRSVVSDSQLTKKTKRAPGSVIRCPREGCEKIDLKNHSDLKKHINQHDKPFRCEVRGCDKAEDGFGTSNDLERHRASVHKLIQRCGTKVGYICMACEQIHPGELKWWPRKDNFKSHIRRKHSQMIEDQLIEQSRRNFRPLDAVSVARSAISPNPRDEDQLHHSFSGLHTEAQQTDFYLPSHSNNAENLAGEAGQWTNEDPMANQMAPRSMQMPSSVHFNAYLGDASTHAGANIHTSPADSVLLSGDMPSSNFRIHIPAQNTQLDEIDTIGWHQPALRPRSTAGESQSTRLTSGGFKCPQCGKLKRRACDLRKHQKRHTRPYGCTFPRCFKRFGSRNDWKRHENTQHFLSDQWRCQLTNHDNTLCAKLFDTEAKMSQHLDSRHGNEGYHHDNPVHFDAIRASHLGHEGHHNFWCGFCNTLIPQQAGVHQSNWDPRFQHIGDHFDKNKFTIDDWIDIEENKKKRFISPPKSSKQAVGRDSSGEESDLGDDGIPDTGVSGSQTTAFGQGVSPRRGAYAAARRFGMDGEADAEGESDHEFV